MENTGKHWTTLEMGVFFLLENGKKKHLKTLEMAPSGAVDTLDLGKTFTRIPGSLT